MALSCFFGNVGSGQDNTSVHVFRPLLVDSQSSCLPLTTASMVLL